MWLLHPWWSFIYRLEKASSIGFYQNIQEKKELKYICMRFFTTNRILKLAV